MLLAVTLLLTYTTGNLSGICRNSTEKRIPAVFRLLTVCPGISLGKLFTDAILLTPPLIAQILAFSVGSVLSPCIR
jgi:hypothetical protein